MGKCFCIKVLQWKADIERQKQSLLLFCSNRDCEGYLESMEQVVEQKIEECQYYTPEVSQTCKDVLNVNNSSSNEDLDPVIIQLSRESFPSTGKYLNIIIEIIYDAI